MPECWGGSDRAGLRGGGLYVALDSRLSSRREHLKVWLRKIIDERAAVEDDEIVEDLVTLEVTFLLDELEGD